MPVYKKGKLDMLEIYFKSNRNTDEALTIYENNFAERMQSNKTFQVYCY